MDRRRALLSLIEYKQTESSIIFYTSSDGNIVTPYNTNVFGANIVSNNYVNGQGIISFDGPVTEIGDLAFRDCVHSVLATAWQVYIARLQHLQHWAEPMFLPLTAVVARFMYLLSL